MNIITSFSRFISAPLALFALFVQPICASAADAVRFTYRLPVVGQHGVHDTQFALNFDISLTQAGQVISAESKKLTRDQARDVTIVEVAGQCATKAQVHYQQSREAVALKDQQAASATQPIEGKTYLVERRGNDLIVTDPQGNPVVDPERSLVAATMDWVGRPSALGVFLNGKELATGQTLNVSSQLASDILGLKETGGQAKQVDLTLRGVRQDQDHRIADFDMTMSLALAGGGTINVQGALQIDPDTCQLAAATFSGPVSMHEEHGPQGHTYEVSSTGTMTVAVHSRLLK